MSEPVLWAKEGRRQPTMVGQDAAGNPLWGGPYTIYQLGAVLAIGIGGFSTRHLWGPELTIIVQSIYVAGAAFLGGLAAGRIDFVQSNPVWSVTGWVKATWRAFTQPHGSLSLPTGRAAWKPEKPHSVGRPQLQILPLIEDLELDSAPGNTQVAGGEVAAQEDEPLPLQSGRAARWPRLRLRRAPRPAADEATADEATADEAAAAEAAAYEATGADGVDGPIVGRRGVAGGDELLDLLEPSPAGQVLDPPASIPVSPLPVSPVPSPASSTRQSALESFWAAADRSHP